MHSRSATALLVATGLSFQRSFGELITITQYPSTCAAIYTSGTRTVTVVHSTITVSPVPWTDADANNGSPFLLYVQPSPLAGSYKRDVEAPAPVMVEPNGKTTNDPSEAARYVINGGQLSTLSGGHISTSEGVDSMPFAVSSTLQSISHTFAVRQGVLNWTNVAFDDGIAELCREPAGMASGAQLKARFRGYDLEGCEGVVLVARPVVETQPGVSSTYISTGFTVGSMSPGPSSSPAGQPTGTGSGYSGVPSTTGQATSPSQSAGSISPNGTCGGAKGYACLGSGFGDCCSGSGYCGAGDTYCGSGCQGAYGACNLPATTSTMSMSMPASMASSPSSSISPIPTYICPADDGKIVTDLYGVQYELGCARDSIPGAYGSAPVSKSFDECFALCDGEAECSGFTYSGAPEGNGPGTCFFKSGQMAFVNQGLNLVAAIRQLPGSGSSTSSSAPTSTYTSTAGPIGPIGPPGGSVPLNFSRSSTSMMSMSSLSTPPSIPVSMSTATSATPSSTAPVSPNGHCGTQGNGGSSQGYTCAGSPFGMCCSTSGFCGNSTAYCLAGCQSGYGSCTPQGRYPITSNGHCGVNSGNSTCTGGIFGPCCSTSGYCGSTEDYCGAGNCDPIFGICDGVSTSTSMMSSTAIQSSISSSAAGYSTPQLLSSTALTTSLSNSLLSTTQMMTSSSSSRLASSTASTSSSPATSRPSSPNPVCPAANSTGYTDTMGNQYIVFCDTTTYPGAYASAPEPDFGSCINACSGQASCIAVTYFEGNCFFKNEYDGKSGSDEVEAAVLQSLDGGIQPGTFTPASSSSTVMVTSSSSGTLSSAVIPSTSSIAAVTSTSSSAAVSSTSTSPSSSSPAATSTSTSQSSSSSAAFSITSSSSSSSRSSSSQGATTTTITTTTSSTTWSSSSISSSSTSNYLILPSPTACSFGDPPGTDEDDSYCQIALPFNMQVYSKTDTNSYPSTNGILSILVGSSQYSAMMLPASNIPNNTVSPFWDDLYLYANSNPQQGIFYQFNTAQTAVTYEYYLARAGTSGLIYHFTVDYDSLHPGVFTFTYYSAGGSGDEGLYASVGTQGLDATNTEQGFTYSFQSQDITPGLVVVCNTLANTCTTTHAGSKAKAKAK